MAEYEILNGVGYSPDADQRTYQPPPASTPFEAPTVTAGAVQREGTALEQAHAAILHAQKEFQRHLETTSQSRHHYSADGYRDQIAKFQQTDAAKAVDEAVDRVRARRDAAQAKVDKMLNPSSRGDAAHESRNSRYWQGARDILDNSKDGKYAAAQRLIKAADREQLAVLVEELPRYMTAHNQPHNWIAHEVAQVLPEYPAAKAELDKANAALQIVRQNAMFLRNGFEQGRAQVALVDPFKDGGRLANRHDPDQ